MKIPLALILCLLALAAGARVSGADKPAPAFPFRLLLVRVESDALYPNKPGKFYTCPQGIDPRRSGKLDTICISNDCGKEVVTFLIEQNLYGKDEPKGKIALVSGISEFCKPRVPIGSPEPLLLALFDVNGKEDDYRFVELDRTKEGALFFLPSRGGAFGRKNVVPLVSSVTPANPISLGPIPDDPHTFEETNFLKRIKVGCVNGQELEVCGGVKVDDFVRFVKQEAGRQPISSPPSK